MASNVVVTRIAGPEIQFNNTFYKPKPAPPRKRQPSEISTVKSSSGNGPQILTFALQQRPRATRASVPKVRTGCVTCKKRHVKCDEAKPSCSRCIKWQGFCEGYDARPTTSATNSDKNSSTGGSSSSGSASPPGSRSPLSKASSDSSNTSIVTSADGTLKGVVTVLPNPGGNHVFTSGWEKVYFNDWLGMAENIGGEWFTSNLFTKTIPQLAHQDAALRHAMMAIGAMANAVAPTFLPGACSGPTHVGPHYKNALSYYGQALRLVRLHQGPSDSQLRSALIACLLFVCFETLHGHREAALHHINHGMMIVEQFLRIKQASKDQQLIDGIKPSPSPTVKSARSIDSAPSPKDDRPVIELEPDSPSPEGLDEEIIQVFQRLDFQSWSTAIIVPTRRAPRLGVRTTGMHDVNSIPSIFHSLQEARRWWDLVQHWILHFPRTIVDEMASLTLSDPQRAQNLLDYCDLPGVDLRRAEYLACLEKWNAAFWPLYVNARADSRTSPDNYYRAASLRLQYQIAWISTRAICFSDYESMYNLTPHFRELNRLGAILLPAQSQLRGGGMEIFTLDNGPTMALFVTATKCRDEGVREEAIALMKKYPRRDGFWDSRCAVLIAELNRQIEEANMQDGTLAEQWWRLRQREAVFDPSGTAAKIRYYKKDPERGWELTEVILTLKEAANAML